MGRFELNRRDSARASAINVSSNARPRSIPIKMEEHFVHNAENAPVSGISNLLSICYRVTSRNLRCELITK